MTPPKPHAVAERRSPRQARSEGSVAAVLSAARSLLTSHGARDVNVRMIAETGSVSPAAVYRYYRDVDELVDVLLSEHAGVAESTVAAALERSRHRSVACATARSPACPS